MPREIGFGVIGLGMGQHHCKAIQTAPGARLVAVCDVDEERLRPAAQEFGCKGYLNFRDMIDDAQIEVVNIATPSGSHAAVGTVVAAAGKHMIVEKPADITAERIAQLMDAGRRHRVKIAGIFQSRFVPLNLRIRSAIQAGRLGRLIGVHGHLPWYRLQDYYEGTHGSWKGTWEMDGGGSLMNQGVHTVDLLQWLVGPVEAVMGMFGVFGHRIEAEDQTAALLRFANGALGTLYTTTCCYPGYDQRITIYGSQGSIVKEEGTLRSWKLQDDPERIEEKQLLELYGGGASSGAVDPMAVSFDGHTQIIVDMIEAIEQDREPAITLDSASHAVEIINAVYTSGRIGRQVRVGETPAESAEGPPPARLQRSRPKAARAAKARKIAPAEKAKQAPQTKQAGPAKARARKTPTAKKTGKAAARRKAAGRPRSSVTGQRAAPTNARAPGKPAQPARRQSMTPASRKAARATSAAKHPRKARNAARTSPKGKASQKAKSVARTSPKAKAPVGRSKAVRGRKR